MATSEMTLGIKVSWWARYFIMLARCWYRITRREPDYIRVIDFVTRRGIKLKVNTHAAGLGQK